MPAQFQAEEDAISQRQGGGMTSDPVEEAPHNPRRGTQGADGITAGEDLAGDLRGSQAATQQRHNRDTSGQTLTQAEPPTQRRPDQIPRGSFPAQPPRRIRQSCAAHGVRSSATVDHSARQDARRGRRRSDPDKRSTGAQRGRRRPHRGAGQGRGGQQAQARPDSSREARRGRRSASSCTPSAPGGSRKAGKMRPPGRPKREADFLIFCTRRKKITICPKTVAKNEKM